MRGKAAPLEPLRLALRITPACAGKSQERLKALWKEWDHPRMCGEKRHLLQKTDLLLGSPPHVRGKGRLSFACSHRTRITPACAGKRKIAVVTLSALLGSPPHVRGKECVVVLAVDIDGITPACAGKRLKKSALYHSFGSHKPHFSFSFKYTSFISKQSSSALCD